MVKGKINKANLTYFDLQIIMNFQPVTFEIKNTWKNSIEKYTGSALRDVLQFLEVDESATALDVIASNDYRMLITMEDELKYEYILSYKHQLVWYVKTIIVR